MKDIDTPVSTKDGPSRDQLEYVYHVLNTFRSHGYRTPEEFVDHMAHASLHSRNLWMRARLLEISRKESGGDISDILLAKFSAKGKIVLDYKYFSVTYRIDGLVGPGGGGNVVCMSRWSIFFHRLYRTPSEVVENFKEVCSNAGLGLQQLNEFAYTMTVPEVAP